MKIFDKYGNKTNPQLTHYIVSQINHINNNYIQIQLESSNIYLQQIFRNYLIPDLIDIVHEYLKEQSKLLLLSAKAEGNSKSEFGFLKYINGGYFVCYKSILNNCIGKRFIGIERLDIKDTGKLFIKTQFREIENDYFQAELIDENGENNCFTVQFYNLQFSDNGSIVIAVKNYSNGYNVGSLEINLENKVISEEKSEEESEENIITESNKNETQITRYPSWLHRGGYDDTDDCFSTDSEEEEL
jgi:hypothetical protein